jgi:hypothetical protein
MDRRGASPQLIHRGVVGPGEQAAPEVRTRHRVEPETDSRTSSSVPAGRGVEVVDLFGVDPK